MYASASHSTYVGTFDAHLVLKSTFNIGTFHLPLNGHASLSLESSPMVAYDPLSTNQHQHVSYWSMMHNHQRSTIVDPLPLIWHSQHHNLMLLIYKLHIKWWSTSMLFYRCVKSLHKNIQKLGPNKRQELSKNKDVPTSEIHLNGTR